MSAPLHHLRPMSADERRVLALLLRGPLSVPEIAARLSLPDLAVRIAVVVLGGFLRGLIALDGGAWRVVDPVRVVALLNAETQAAAVADVLRRKAELGRAVAHGQA